MFTRSITWTVSCSALVFGCAGNNADDASQEIVDNLVQAGFPTSDIQVVDGKVVVGNDAEVSLPASREMLESPAGKEQYRFSNLVGGPSPTTICVNGAEFTNATLSAGLNLAIDNYNQLFNAGRSRLRFVRITGGTIPGCTFFINGVVQLGLVGGSAGFPGGGAPFGTIRIGSGLIPLGTDLTEHVITHELGHCIGLHHSDFFDPTISCGASGPPPSTGAIWIPGTPTGAAVGQSLMNTCFRTIENGELTPTDMTAIDVLY